MSNGTHHGYWPAYCIVCMHTYIFLGPVVAVKYVFVRLGGSVSDEHDGTVAHCATVGNIHLKHTYHSTHPYPLHQEITIHNSHL